MLIISDTMATRTPQKKKAPTIFNKTMDPVSHSSTLTSKFLSHYWGSRETLKDSPSSSPYHTRFFVLIPSNILSLCL